MTALLHRPHDASAPLPSAALRLYDAEGRLLAEATSPVCWDSNGCFGALTYSFDIPDPRPWQPADPYLYRLELHTAYERCSTEFGLRTVQARAGKLLLNGQPIILQGVCRHQEDRDAGWRKHPPRSSASSPPSAPWAATSPAWRTTPIPARRSTCATAWGCAPGSRSRSTRPGWVSFATCSTRPGATPARPCGRCPAWCGAPPGWKTLSCLAKRGASY